MNSSKKAARQNGTHTARGRRTPIAPAAGAHYLFRWPRGHARREPKVGRKLLGKQPYDLLITDVNLPDGSGLDLADEALAAGLKTLVLTGHGLKLRPGRLNGYHYLLKPIRVAELTKAIRECLAQKDGDANIVPFLRT